VRSTPAVGTIGVSSGHVAWVTAVSADGKTVTVSEMNCWRALGQTKCSKPDEPLNNARESVNNRSYSASWFTGGYIYCLRSPYNLQAKVVLSRWIQISWRDRTNCEQGFKIYRVGGGFSKLLTAVGANTTTYVDTTVQPKTRYCYQVAAFNADGEVLSSTQACITTRTFLKTGALIVADFLMTPSLTSKEFEFAVDGERIAKTQVEVFDLSGRSVFASGEVEGTTLTWGLQNNTGQPLPNGVYLYIITVRGYDGQVIRSEVKKLVILR
jgi:surface antigen